MGASKPNRVITALKEEKAAAERLEREWDHLLSAVNTNRDARLLSAPSHFKWQPLKPHKILYFNAHKQLEQIHVWVLAPASSCDSEVTESDGAGRSTGLI